MKYSFKSYVSGFITAALLTSVVFASPVSKSILVNYNNIKIFVDGKLQNPKDGNGNPVEPFIYNGTTYLPVRAVSEAIGKNVFWDGKTYSVYIGERGNGTDSSLLPKGPSIDGIGIFPQDNFWNTHVDKLPIHPKSDAYIASIGREKTMHPDFGTIWEGNPIGIPYNVVPDDQPLTDVKFEYEDESDKGPYPIPQEPLIEAGSDRHMLILRNGSNILYELYASTKNADGSWNAGSGAIWHLDKNEARPKGWTSADASGLAILPGLVRWDEVNEKREINHAIRITLSRIQKAYIHPASHSGGSYKTDEFAPMGLRLRLKQDYDISGFDESIQVILKAFKTYGVVVADVGSDMYISGVPDSRWDDELLRELKRVKAGDFEAVYTGEAEQY